MFFVILVVLGLPFVGSFIAGLLPGMIFAIEGYLLSKKQTIKEVKQTFYYGGLFQKKHFVTKGKLILFVLLFPVFAIMWLLHVIGINMGLCFGYVLTKFILIPIFFVGIRVRICLSQPM